MTSTRVRQAGPVHREPHTLPKDLAFELLSNQRRRYVLHALVREGGVATVREVCERLVSWDGGDETTVATDLREEHVPRLEAAGVLAYYTASDVVELLGPADELRPYLELAAADDLGTQTD